MVLLTTSDVASRLGITSSAVTARVREGKLQPLTKLNGIRGAYVFDAAEVERVEAGDAA